MAKQNLQPLKGFRDFLPAEARKRAYAIRKINDVFEAFGFEPLETPTLERKELLLGKYGEEADKLVYSFTDHGGREVALRYDQTVPTARILAMYNQELPMPWRRSQIQPVWRAENTQKGRYREFLQCDADIFGATSPLSDAELVSLSYAIFKNLGFDGVEILINDRQVLFTVMENVGIEKDLQLSVIQSIDKLDKKSEEEVGKELVVKGLSKKSVEDLFAELKITKPTEYLSQVMTYANALGVHKSALIFQPYLARGLDYYTGTIFEVKIKGYPAGSVLGGGRYDNLIGLLSGVDIPAVGFAVGFDRTIDAMEEFGLFPKDTTSTDILVSVFDKETATRSAEVAMFLRSQHVNVELYPSDNTKLEKQFKFANKKQIKYVLVIGPEELKKDSVILKNMGTGDQQEFETLEKLNEELFLKAFSPRILKNTPINIKSK